MTWNERLESVMKQGLNQSTVKEVFALHNEKVPDLFPNRETKTFCGGCTQRVWKRLLNYYEKCKTNTNQ